MARRRRQTGRNKTSGVFGCLFTVFLLLLLASGGAAWLLLTPYGPESETFVNLPSGSSTMRMGERLEAAGVVRSRWAFDLMRWWKRGRLRAGEYRFDHPATVAEVYSRIARGDVFTRAVTIPEGSGIYETAARLEQAGISSRQDFLNAALHQTALISDLDPDAKSLEGYLFPDTYHFSRKATPEQVCATMVKRFRAEATLLGLNRNMHHVVTIASLVERETALESERPLVASVFENRLAKNMPLMTDPAVIYGLERADRWRGAIYASDLKFDTPYNTYLHAGLPPGPISNPGIRSLRAAMNPAHTDYYYFVAAGANPQGRSIFSRTLEEHNHNVSSYRKATEETPAKPATKAAAHPEHTAKSTTSHPRAVRKARKK